MGLYSECSRCKQRIDDYSTEERNGYPKISVTIMKEDGKITNVDLCHECRKKFMTWLAVEKEEKE